MNLKTLSAMLIFAVLTLVLTIQIFATSNTYTLDELGLEISIPSSYDVITQDTSPYSSVFTDRGLSGTDIIDQLKTNNIYLNAAPSVGTNEEIVVTMTAGIWNNLSEFSNGSLKTMASSLVNSYADYGLAVTNYDVYEHSQAKFIKMFFNDAEKTVYGLQYYTNYDSKTINIMIRSYSGAITQTQENVIKGIIDSIAFDTDPIIAPPAPETDSFVYTDVETNTKFTVPANWYEIELSKEREFIDVKFASGKEEGLSIMYGSTDMWSMMTEEEKKGHVRSDVSNSAFTNELVAEMIGADESDVSKVFYNGKDYFQVTVKTNKEMYGANFIVEMTHVLRFENGWSYWFQFGGTTSNEYFADFQELLNTVEYPYYQKEISTARIKIALVFTAIIVMVVFLLSLFINKKIQKSEQKARLTTTVNKSCPYCNATLLDDSDFCHKCGKNLSVTIDSKNNL